ncbi:hypothetical protein PRIPAC_76851 [Pristionchus pacificus]|uniref:Uncharacterized protein n=1 Tax=Pristionchus pacificus TaxID=54126 RepID=A0A2A6CLL9_PRIPA|nr:hypothetical protein PRIPAC_76851 [Pristionchus pacificus]|eukprot:PDM79009.1 hypothetical protein PRIPAC_31588 [Pristionchus pacificus]
METTPTGDSFARYSSEGLAVKLYAATKVIVDLYVRFLGSHELSRFRIPGLLEIIKSFACRQFLNYEFCRDNIFLTVGPPAKTFNSSRMPVYLSHFFESTSTLALLQYAPQNAYRLGVFHFDVSTAENVKRYGQ